jgi:hypothetical protein
MGRAESSTHRNGDQLRVEPPSKISIVPWGELATIIGLAEDANPFENKDGFSLIAGARNRRYLHLDYAPMEI